MYRVTQKDDDLKLEKCTVNKVPGLVNDLAKKQVYSCRESLIRDRHYNFRRVVSEVSPFVDNPVSLKTY